VRSLADAERQKIEQDLHDGAQQRLVALGIKLDMAAQTTRDPAQARALRSMRTDVDEIIDEMRRLVRGIYPPELEALGLVHALRAAVRRTPLPVHVRAAELGRYPREIERAAYFSCLEAVQNAVKHARGASRVTIHLRSDDRAGLCWDVLDDGAGFDAQRVEPGGGLLGMRERVRGAGGELVIRSRIAQGTEVHATIPARPLLAGRPRV
jgi:signal transduction histidine kinase